MQFHEVYSTPGAADILWDLMLEREGENEHNISFKMPMRDEHEAFIANTPYAHWYLIESDGEWLGYVSVSWRNEIGIVLFKEHRGKGVGREALRRLLAIAFPLPGEAANFPGHFVANINPSNEHSIRLFQSLGFELVQHTYALRRRDG
jgi:RimJ/RimL family protein N-acetyltransferase